MTQTQLTTPDPKKASIQEIREYVFQVFAQMRREVWDAPRRPPIDVVIAENAPSLEKLAEEVRKEDEFLKTHGYYPWDAAAARRAKAAQKRAAEATPKPGKKSGAGSKSGKNRSRKRKGMA